MFKTTLTRTLLVGGLLATLPLTTACTIDLSGLSGARPTVTVVPPSEGADPTATDRGSASGSESGTESSSEGRSSGSGSTGSGPSDGGSSTSGSGSSGASSSTRESVQVPSGSGINSMDVLHIYGGMTGSGAYGRAVAILEVDVDEPMFITTKIELLDEDGKLIRDGEAINRVARAGTSYLVTSNLVKIEPGERPAKFRVNVVETLASSSPVFDELSQPTLNTSGDTPTLTGSYSYTGEPGSIEVRGACVQSDGRIAYGSKNMADSPSSGEYEVSLFESEASDLAGAQCYASV